MRAEFTAVFSPVNATYEAATDEWTITTGQGQSKVLSDVSFRELYSPSNRAAPDALKAAQNAKAATAAKLEEPASPPPASRSLRRRKSAR